MRTIRWGRRAVRAAVLATLVLLAGLVPAGAATNVRLNHETTWDVPGGGAEIIAHAGANRLLVTEAGSQLVALVDYSDLAHITQLAELDTSPWGEPTSVTVHGSTAYVAVKNDPKPGTVLVVSLPRLAVVRTIKVGTGPDSIAVSKSGRTLVVVIEDEQTEVGDPTDCPPENTRPGRLDIINLAGRGRAGAAVLKSVAFNLTGIPGVNCPSDPQPELVALDGDSTAYVTLQENNAIAKVDLVGAKVDWIRSAGLTTHVADTEDGALVAIDDPFTGRREPDGVALVPGARVFITADEGDSDDIEVNGVTEWSGGRTISLWNSATGALIADTGAQLERAIAQAGLYPTGRANNRGPEPENLTVLTYEGRTYAALGAERANALVLIDVTNPSNPLVVDVVGVGAEPEGVLWNGSRNLIITANEADGSLSFVSID